MCICLIQKNVLSQRLKITSQKIDEMHMASRNCQHRFSLYHLTTEKTGAFKLKEDSLRYKKDVAMR